MSVGRVSQIRSRLKIAFDPVELEISDDGHLHEGHAGAQSGKGHFSVRIVSKAFVNTTPVERHRMVFEALSDLMQTDIHALSVSALPPELKAQ